MGICFLHSHGVIHGDLHLGNILFTAPSPDSYTAEELEHDETMEDFVITRPNATLDKCAPRYIAVTSPLIEHFCDGSELAVKITDLGGLFYARNHPSQTPTPEAFPNRTSSQSRLRMIVHTSHDCTHVA